MVTKDTARAHIVIPRELLEAVDELVGSRKRSEFIVEAIRQRVRRERLGRAIDSTAGILNPADYPEWANGSSDWVHDMRQADDRHRAKKLGGWMDP
jgi:metal-responsive CopG/Arc/MetJ family transcriptional regulator